MINVRKLDTFERKDVDAWVALPYRLYAGDPLWVPQMVNEARDQLDRKKYPYYLHSDADFFIAEKDGVEVARVVVLQNNRYNELRGEQTAFFTHFETIENFAVAEALFSEVFEWCSGRGLNKLVGPKGFLTADGMGMLVEGFDRPPAIGIAYNPPFYHDFMIRLGFERETDFMSGWVPCDYELDERVVRIAERVRQRYGFEFMHFKSKKEIKEIAPKIIETYNASFVENWEYVPITPEEGEYIEKRLLDILLPELPSVIVKDDEIVGFVLVYPDISNAIRRTGGRLWPFGWFHLLREFKRTEWVNMNGAGVLPQYQGRGVDAMLFVQLARTLKATPYKYAEIVQIDEGNAKMQADMTALGVTFDKRHRIFHRAL